MPGKHRVLHKIKNPWKTGWLKNKANILCTKSIKDVISILTIENCKFAIDVDLNKLIIKLLISLYTCAPTSELPSNTSYTIDGSSFQNFD